MKGQAESGGVAETRMKGHAETGGDCGDKDEIQAKRGMFAETSLKGQAERWRFRSR